MGDFRDEEREGISSSQHKLQQSLDRLGWRSQQNIQPEGNSSPWSRETVGFRFPTLGVVAARTQLIARVFCGVWTAPTP